MKTITTKCIVCGKELDLSHRLIFVTEGKYKHQCACLSHSNSTELAEKIKERD